MEPGALLWRKQRVGNRKHSFYLFVMHQNPILFFSLMDLIEERLEEDSGPFSAYQVARVATDVARALEYLHGEKLLMHGDLKSGNVLVFGEDFRLVKLCDFGVALPLSKPNGPVKPGHYYVGTEAWSAPEVINHDESLPGDAAPVITCKADIFSYGLTIWYLSL